MSKVKKGYINKRDNLYIRLIKITPLIITIMSIILVFGFCWIGNK